VIINPTTSMGPLACSICSHTASMLATRSIVLMVSPSADAHMRMLNSSSESCSFSEAVALA
jgi:hypothetical protein